MKGKKKSIITWEKIHLHAGQWVNNHCIALELKRTTIRAIIYKRKKHKKAGKFLKKADLLKLLLQAIDYSIST